MKMVLNKRFGAFRVTHTFHEMWNEKYPDKRCYSEYDFNELRTDPDFISEVEDNGPVANLIVVKLPENTTDYYVQDYDGLETVIYVIDGKLRFD